MAAAVIDLFSKQAVPPEEVPNLRIAPDPRERERPSSEELVREFLGRYNSKNTVENYTRDLRYLTGFLSLSDTGLYEARTPHGSEWASYELYENERSPNSVRRYLGTATELFTYAMAEGYHHRNPIKNVERPTVLSMLPYRGPDLADLGRLAEHLRFEPDLRVRATITVLMTTGVRVSELCAARVEDLHPHGGKLWLPVVRKGGYQDAVELPTVTQEVLYLYLGGRGEGPLILGAQGGAISRTSVWRMVRRVGEEALPHLERALHPHAFRHAFVSAILLLSGRIEEAQWRAGHRDIRSTMTYLHELTAQQSTTPEELEQLFGLTW